LGVDSWAPLKFKNLGSVQTRKVTAKTKENTNNIEDSLKPFVSFNIPARKDSAAIVCMCEALPPFPGNFMGWAFV
jgi:hypothetical protein